MFAVRIAACLSLLVGFSLQVDVKSGKEAGKAGNFMEDEQWLSTISQYSRKIKHWNRFRDVSGVFFCFVFFCCFVLLPGCRSCRCSHLGGAGCLRWSVWRSGDFFFFFFAHRWTERRHTRAARAVCAEEKHFKWSNVVPHGFINSSTLTFSPSPLLCSRSFGRRHTKL